MTSSGPLVRLPGLFDAQGKPVAPVSAWFRYLIWTKKVPKNTLKQSVATMRNFWQYLDDHSLGLYGISNTVLTKWRDSDQAAGLKTKTCNQKVGLILRFLLWAHENNVLPGVVGILDAESQTSAPVTVRVTRARSGERRLHSEVILRVHPSPRKPVPTDEQMEAAYREISDASDADLVERNCLILTISELTGMRQSELAEFPRSHVPDWPQIRSLIENDTIAEFDVRGKGAKIRKVHFLPELLEGAREYLDGPRARVISRLRLEFDPPELFISHTSGKGLQPKSISNLFSAIFKPYHLSHHRVRARFLQGIVDREIEDEVQRAGLRYSRHSVLLRAAVLAGHAHTSTTLAHYVDLGFKNRVGAGAAEPQDKEQRVLALDRQILLKRRVLQDYREVLKLLSPENADNINHTITQEKLDDLLTQLRKV